MTFKSIDFLIFFPIVTFLYFFLPFKFRWLHLLIASCIFYCFFIPEYLLILIFTIVIDYFAGLWIEKSEGKNKKYALIISLLANIGVLAVFKYVYFIVGNLQAVNNLFGFGLDLNIRNIILPIGLSFHTFQAMSYTIEVYRGNQKAEKHFGIYALYVMFYPQLVAGPIERPQNVIQQFKVEHKFSEVNMVAGLQQMLWGFFKKVFVADRLGIYVDQVYSQPTEYQGLPLFVATVLFSIQIYCDFSGYSDIAIGSARTMGFDLMTNFDRPYFAKSMGEHWRRWHISLSTWFRDYVYIPLGGNRVSKYRSYINTMIVFAISGLWHGDKWHYIIWGCLHGFYIVMGQITKKQQDIFFGFFGNGFINKLLQAGTCYFLLLFAWVFFRTKSLNEGFYFIKNAFKFNETEKKSDFISLFSTYEWSLAIIGIVILFSVEWVMRDRNYLQKFNLKSRTFKWSVYYVFILMIIILGEFGDAQFIYFQF